MLGRPLTPLETYGLWLNRHRVHLQRAAPFAEAARAAQGNSARSLAWFDAREDWPEEADLLHRGHRRDVSERAIIRGAR